jgi:transposase-like protein
MVTRLKKEKIGSDVKAKVVLDALREEQTLSQLGSRYKVSPAQICQWKKQAVANLQSTFSKKGHKDLQEQEDLVRDLYEQIGRLKVENEWLKKKLQL